MLFSGATAATTASADQSRKVASRRRSSSLRLGGAVARPALECKTQYNSGFAPRPIIRSNNAASAIFPAFLVAFVPTRLHGNVADPFDSRTQIGRRENWAEGGEMTAKVLSVLNMKGGVGKTTFSAHAMRVFYLNRRKNVLLLDLDAQYNLTQSVINQLQYDKLKEQGKTVISCFEPAPSDDFFSVKKTDKAPALAEEISITLKKTYGNLYRLDLIAGDFQIVKYSLIDDPVQLKSSLKYFKRFISRAKADYDLIVFDCNPSSSFITKCALETSDFVISPVKPDKYSVIGVSLVDQLIGHLGLSPAHLILMNGTKRSEPPTSVENELRAHPKFGPNVLASHIHHSTLLHADQSYTGFATDKRKSWSGTVRNELGKLAAELGLRLGL
jgi:chromosome partitioning protein